MASYKPAPVWVRAERRPCYVKPTNSKIKGEVRILKTEDLTRAMWHKWVDVAQAIPQSMLPGGHPAGIIRDTLALVEYEDGTMAKVHPERVIFADYGDFADTAFLPPEGRAKYYQEADNA